MKFDRRAIVALCEDLQSAVDIVGLHDDDIYIRHGLNIATSLMVDTGQGGIEVGRVVVTPSAERYTVAVTSSVPPTRYVELARVESSTEVPPV